MRRPIMHLIAVFCIYLMINITLVQAFSITYNPASGINVTDRTAVIKWNTDDLSTSRVNYGATNALGSFAVENSSNTSDTSAFLTKDHAVTLANLQPGTLYYYGLVSRNESGSIANANNSMNYYTFTTAADTTPPAINVTLPAYHNARWIGFTGLTEPDCIVRVYVNRPDSDIGTMNYDYIASSDSTGIFVFPRVNLPLDRNDAVIWAKDSAGNTNYQRYHVEIDLVPPKISLKVTSSDTSMKFSINYIPSISPSSSLIVDGNTSEPVNITYRVNNDTQTLSSDSSFSITLNLDENQDNIVLMQFADKAGNTVSYSSTIRVDAQAPTIISTNLRELDPTYVQNVKITGKVSKPDVNIVVFVNNKTKSLDSWSTSLRDIIVHYGGLQTGTYEESYTTRSDSNGDFEITVFLTQDVASGTTEYEFTQPYDTSQPTPSTQQNPSNMQSTAPSSFLGVPSSWDNRIQILAVDDFGRKAEEDGLIRFAKCGVGGDWNIKLSDVTPSVITPDHLAKEGLAELSFWGELEWRGPGEDKAVTVLGVSRQPQITSLSYLNYPLSEDVRKKFAIDPNVLAGSPQGSIDPKSKRSFYVTIPLHKVDYTQKKWEELKDKFDSDDFAVMVPVEIDIRYTYYDNQGKQVDRVQKQCVDVRSMLDVQIPPEVIPKWLLEDTAKFLGKTIETIDSILVPLKQITMTIFVTCLLSWVVYFVMLVQQRFTCMGNADSSGCRSAKENVEKTKVAMHWICDRVFCPSIPMINKYIKDTGVPGGKTSDGEAVCDSAQANNLQYISEQQGSPSTNQANIEKTGCGQQYMNDWDSACVGMQNELEESKCLLAGTTGNQALASGKACQNELQNLLRKWSLSDICSKDTASADNENKCYGISDYVSGTSSGAPVTASATNLCKTKDKDGKEYWHYCRTVTPIATNTNQVGAKIVGECAPSSTCPGYLGVYGTKLSFIVPDYEKDKYSKKINAVITSTGEYVTLYTLPKGGNCALVPDPQKGTVTSTGCAIDSLGRAYYLTAPQQGFQVSGEDPRPGAMPAYAYCLNGGPIDAPSSVNADYKDLQRQFVVNPTKDLKTSVMCVCLPAINGHLQLWRNILTQVKQCFETIAVTGQGKAGVCRAVLSNYVCDVLFRAIRCFTQMAGGGTDTDINNYNNPAKFFKSVANAGQDIQKEITGRYGDTGLYNTMFNERKLMTAACVFAFTGDFDFDVEGLVTGTGSVPLESKAAVYPHTRRFMNSDPREMGIATWIYNIGVGISAGSDINYHLYLVCSDKSDCAPSEGFYGGRCDCAGKGEKVYDITNEAGGGYMGYGEATDIVNQGNIFVKVKDSVRYDAVRLVIEPTGSETKNMEPQIIEAKITQIGDKPPADCKFDSGAFRCGFTVGNIGYAVFVRQPALTQSDYRIGDSIMATGDVDKRSPGFDPNVPEKSNPTNQIPFLIKYDLLNANGAPITGGSGLIQVVADGTKTYSIPQNGFKLTQSQIIGGGLVAGTYELANSIVSDISATKIAVKINANPAHLQKSDTATLSDFFVRFDTGAIVTDPKDISKQSIDKAKIQICEGQITTDAQGVKKFTVPSSPRCVNPDSAAFTADKMTIIIKVQGMEIAAAVTVTKPKDTPVSSLQDYSGFVYLYAAPPASAATANAMASARLCDGNEQTWTLYIGLYRCRRVSEDQPYSYSNCAWQPESQVEQSYNTPMEYQLPVKVVCSQTETLGPCFTDMLVSKECVCDAATTSLTSALPASNPVISPVAGSSTCKAGSGITAKAGQICHMDPLTMQKSVCDYKPCLLGKKVPSDVSSTNYIQIGSTYYCGCKSNGIIEDCTNKACQLTSQGVYQCS